MYNLLKSRDAFAFPLIILGVTWAHNSECNFDADVLIRPFCIGSLKLDIYATNLGDSFRRYMLDIDLGLLFEFLLPLVYWRNLGP